MGKLLRVIVFVLGGLLLLIVAAAIILPLVVDPNCGVNSEHSVQVLQQWMREAINE